MMTQNHVLSHQKNLHVLDVGLPLFSAFKVCHVMSKRLYHPTANPKVAKVSSFA